MLQKIVKIGNSLGIIIPKNSVEKFGWKVGSLVNVDIDEKDAGISISLHRQLSKEDAKIERLGLAFIKRYRKDLEALAKK